LITGIGGDKALLERVGFYTSEVPMWLFDVQTFSFLEVNHAATRIYGYSRQEFLSMTILDIRPSEDIPPLLREELLRHRHDADSEVWRHRARDGRLFKAHITSRELLFYGRRAELVIATPRDSHAAPAAKEPDDSSAPAPIIRRLRD
jgi:PAS domain S-box-containing protein